MPSSSLLQRLKERKLVQWAFAYLAGAFVILQVLDAVAEPLALSVTVQRAILVFVGFGFLVTLVLAWYHGEKGRQRVSRPELLMVAALLVVVGVALTVLTGERGEPAATGESFSATLDDDRPSIAVLPFQNLSGIEEDAYFTDGMHDEILTRLSKIGGLSVRARTSVMGYRDSPKNLREIGEELNVRYIIEGGVQRAGGTVRINVQLIEASTDHHLWADTYDRAMSVDNVFSIQTEIVPPVFRAMVYAGLDEEDEALAWLEKGYDNRDHWMIWLGTDSHLWGNLLSNPQFKGLLRRMKLSERGVDG